MDLSTRTIPPLRDGVVLEASEEEGGRLPYAAVDRALGQKIRLDPRGMAIAAALERSWQPGTLLAFLEQATGLRFPPHLLVRFVRFLDAHYLLDSERARRRVEAERAREARRPEAEPPIRFLEGTSHACISCGHSCQAHDVGPVAPERVAAIRAGMPGVGGFVDRSTSSEETTGAYCRMVDDVCAFLNAEQLCRVHAALGVDPKPADCRLFPLAFTRTPEGVLAGVQMECRSYIASKRNGGALSDRGEELAELLARVRSVAEVAPVVRLDEDITMPYAEYAALEPRFLAQVADGPPIVYEGLRRLNASIAEALTEAREAERLAWVFPPEPPGPSDTSRSAVLIALAEACERASSLNAAASYPLRAARLTRVAGAARDLAERPPTPAVAGADEDELLRDHLRQSLFLKEPLLAPNVRFGVALLNLSVLLAIRLGEASDDLNAALADTLKALRSSQAAACLRDRADAVAEHFHERLDDHLPADEP